MPLAQRVCRSTLSGGLGELVPQIGGNGGHPPDCCEAAQQSTLETQDSQGCQQLLRNPDDWYP
jgi:hypothetical protein